MLSCNENASLVGGTSGGTGDQAIGKITCVDGVIHQDGYCNCDDCCDPVPAIENAGSYVLFHFEHFQDF